MSRGGKSSGGGRASTSGVRAIANVLGIARHEIGGFTQMKKEPMELYPPLPRHPLTLESSVSVKYMIDTKQELINRFHSSAFYNEKAGKRDVRRYTDKYRALNKETFEPFFERIPAELNWKKGRDQSRAAKRRKIDDDAVKKKLERLAEKEGKKIDEDDIDKKEESDKDEDDEKNEDDEAEPLSDDDYLEEDNDYVQNYFDNGDGYAEGSDDNLDEY